MENQNVPSTLKWVIGIALTAAIGFYVVPFLIVATLNLIVLAGLGVGLAAMYFFIPAIAELLASLGYNAWKAVVESDPIGSAERNLAGFWEDIQQLEKKISEASSAASQFREELKREWSTFTAEDQQEYRAQVDQTNLALQQLTDQRNSMVQEYTAFKQEVERMKVKFKLNKAYSGIGSILNRGKNGKDSATMKIALDKVNGDLAKSRANVGLILSRPSIIPEKSLDSTKTVDGQEVLSLPQIALPPIKVKSRDPISIRSNI